MKIMVIGSGGREHALAHTFWRQGHKVHCFPGNVGTAKICQPLPAEWDGVDICDVEAFVPLVEALDVDLIVCGPEAPLEKGMADAFQGKDIAFFGPTKEASKIECSKAWSKDFMVKYGIPTARYVVCSELTEAKNAIERYFHQWKGIVVKPSGLTAGKGVVVCNTLQEAENAVIEIMGEKKYGVAGSEVVLEEPLSGPEVTIMAFCDGKTIVPMAPSQDHKRLYDGGQGPNTGGMGAYTPTPFLDGEAMSVVEESFLKRTLEGLIAEGIDYKGFIYFGLMVTENGPKLLEYNCRFGDPEAQVVLPLLASDLAEILIDCCQGKLDPSKICWSKGSACCVVMVSRGYPKGYKMGFPIYGMEKIDGRDDVTVFHSGTRTDDSGIVVTSGGRVLSVTAVDETLRKAVSKCYDAVEQIQFEGAYYRLDIAHQALEQGERLATKA